MVMKLMKSLIGMEVIVAGRVPECHLISVRGRLQSFRTFRRYYEKVTLLNQNVNDLKTGTKQQLTELHTCALILFRAVFLFCNFTNYKKSLSRK